MQLVDQGGGSGEADRETLLACGQTESEGYVSLAGAAVADCDDVLAAGDAHRASQFQHQGFVERREGGEGEAVEPLPRRGPGLLDPALDGAPVPVDHLPPGAALQVAGRNPSSKRRTWTNSRLPGLPMRASSSRRSVANSAGSSQPTSGAAWSSAPIFRSSSAR